MDPESLLADPAVVFCAGASAVLLLGRLGLPPMLGFLVAGLLIGPHALGFVDDPHVIETVAELGVALLLFTIGLEFSFDRLRRIGRFVVLGGSLQVGLTILATLLIAVGLGLGEREGVYWGFLAAVSSTAIVLRLLADRREIDAPHGRFVVGVLIFQDLCIVPMMLAVPLLAGAETTAWDLLLVLGKAALVVTLVVVAARKLVPALLGRAARAAAREVFVLAVLSVAALVAWATASLGLSIALGAFLAGIVIAETEFVHRVHAEVSPFRDALASLFFVSVGMLLDPATVLGRPGAVVGLVLVLVVGKLLIAALAVLLMRFPARVALLSGLALAQVGEFSFVLLRAGEEAGLVGASAAALFLAASVVTMIATPLLVGWSPRFAAGAQLLRPLEALLAVRPPDEPAAAPAAPEGHVVVAGLGLGGRTLVRSLEAAGIPYLGLELDPETVIAERAAGHAVRYGDATSLEVLERVAHLASARQVVLLLSDVEAASRAASLIRERHPELPVLLRVHRLERDAVPASLPGVQVVAEDHETAVEVVERVLRRSGVDGALHAAAISVARGARGERGDPIVPPTGLAGMLNMQAVTLGGEDHAVGKSILELNLRATTGGLVVALARDGLLKPSPRPRDPLRAGDTLFLLGTGDQLSEAARRLAIGAEAQGSSTST